MYVHVEIFSSNAELVDASVANTTSSDISQDDYMHEISSPDHVDLDATSFDGVSMDLNSCHP